MYWRITGTRVKIASRPKITLGTAASNSTRNVQTLESLGGASSDKEDGGAHAQWNGNQERQERRQHRSVDEGQRAELLGYRDPKFSPSGS